MLVIVDYKAGNLTSVRLALESLNIEAKITQDPDDLRTAERVIFPGVGAAGTAMQNLSELNLIEALKSVVLRGVPFLGICLGTQVIFEYSEEDGGTPCIGLIPGKVERFRPKDPQCKIPQIGWNEVRFQKNHPVFRGIEDGSEFYFVHSYYPAPAEPAYVLGTTHYADVEFASIVGRNNLIATQFHPERSGRIGLRFLKNFCEWDGIC